MQDYELETALQTPIILGVINSQSEYFGEQFYFTHKMKAAKKLWFKAEMEYQVGRASKAKKGLDVWFKSRELEEVIF